MSQLQQILTSMYITNYSAIKTQESLYCFVEKSNPNEAMRERERQHTFFFNPKVHTYNTNKGTISEQYHHSHTLA